jgi:protein-L-isoaspartate(D-aspartate) O-methyltransferase
VWLTAPTSASAWCASSWRAVVFVTRACWRPCGPYPGYEFLPHELRPFAYEDAPARDRLRADDQPAFHRQRSCASSRPSSRARACSRSARGAATRPPSSPSSPATSYTIEIVEPLAREARATLDRLGYGHVHARHGDGTAGWPEAAPFDAILLAAAPERVPSALLDQLAIGGRLVAPVGVAAQEIQVHRRTAAGVEMRRGPRVAFVPMTGDARGESDGVGVAGRVV